MSAIPFIRTRPGARRSRLAVACAGVCLSCATLFSEPAAAQVHQRAEGGYLVRSTAIASQSLPSEVAKAHGVAPAPGVGVLNVSVYRAKRPTYDPVAAEVQASATDLTGVRQQIPMKPARTQGDVSYYGTYRYLPNEPLDFTVTVRPQGSEHDITLTYQEMLRQD